jgi:hypothetical protein
VADGGFITESNKLHNRICRTDYAGTTFGSAEELIELTMYLAL